MVVKSAADDVSPRVADPNDWVNVNYVLKAAGSGNIGVTSPARQSIGVKADTTAKSGPFSASYPPVILFFSTDSLLAITSNKVKPPSGDIHDYLSWAP